jgi:signal recognition particle GTPase
MHQVHQVCIGSHGADSSPWVQVGAALNMVYSSGAPIMFVGCGQTYVDLKKLNVKSVVNSLLK